MLANYNVKKAAVKSAKSDAREDVRRRRKSRKFPEYKERNRKLKWGDRS